MLVIDRSGSMNYPAPPNPSKLLDAKKSAKLYVDSWRQDDKIGVVSFAATATVDLSLRDWSDAGRIDAFSAIDGLVAGGLTSIGYALASGLDELDEKGATSHSWAMIVLSDGLNTTGDDIDDFLEAYENRKKAGQQVPQVHTVAIGTDANRPDLQKLALQTAGSYHFLSEPTGTQGTTLFGLAADTNIFWQQLSGIFRIVAEKILRHGQVLSVSGTTTEDIVSHAIQVDAGASELVVTVGFKYGSPSIALRDPYGSLQVPFVESTSEHKVFRIAAPVPGLWHMEMGIAASCEEFCASEYLAEAAVKSSLTAELYFGLPLEQRVEGTPMPIFVSLTRSEPLSNAVVEGEITMPSGARKKLSLFDDGNHQDGASGDGIYGAIFRETTQPGSYRLPLEAYNPTSGGENFVRRLNESFDMREDKNEDGDCLPDDFESRMRLDPGSDDGQEDPDQDGLTNCSEYFYGTNPLDPDSDDGGEADGSEILAGQDVHDPRDDDLGSPRIYAYPGAGQVYVKFNVPPGALEYDIYRAEDAEPIGSYSHPPELGEFTLIEASFPAGQPYYFQDRDVINGNRYWYYLVSKSAAGALSAPSNPAAAIPRADPYAPHGTVMIETGGPCTNTPVVMLALTGSDEWEPQSNYIYPFGYDPSAEKSLVAEMLISNRSDFADAEWEPFAARREWLLAPDASGFAAVYARFRDNAGNVSDTVHFATFLDQEPPSIVCPANTAIECDGSKDPDITGIATATDYFDPEPTLIFSDTTVDGSCPDNSVIHRTWSARDYCGNVSSCTQTIVINDTTPPVIAFNAPLFITPPEAPIAFTATAKDNCSADLSVEIVAFDCFAFTKKGKRVDKTYSCVVSTAGDTITITDSGGVDTHISWLVRATDTCANSTESEFSMMVQLPETMEIE